MNVRLATRIAGVSVALVTAAACGSTSSGGASVATRPGAGGLRGVPLPGVSCQATTTTPAARPVPVRSVTSLVICPIQIPNAGSQRVTVQRGSATFDRLVTVLSLPDRPPSRMPCPAYADLPQEVIAITANGAFALEIPVDGCHHYLPQARAVLSQARAARPTTGLPARS